MKYFKLYEKFTKEKSSINDYVLIDIKDLEDTYEYFHISKKFLSDDELMEDFIFQIRVPNDPFNDDDGATIEDDFTPRISLGKTIKECLNAISDDTADGFFVYAIDLKSTSTDDIETINLKETMKKCPLLKGKYDVNFNLREWILTLDKEQPKEYEKLQKQYLEELIESGEAKEGDYYYKEISVEDFIFSPSGLPYEFKKLFYACVPDADQHNEFWSLNNLNMDYVGELLPWKWSDKLILHLDEIEGEPKVLKNLN